MKQNPSQRHSTYHLFPCRLIFLVDDKVWMSIVCVIIHPFNKMVCQFKSSVIIWTIFEINQHKFWLWAVLAQQYVAFLHIVMAENNRGPHLCQEASEIDISLYCTHRGLWVTININNYTASYKYKACTKSNANRGVNILFNWHWSFKLYMLVE